MTNWHNAYFFEKKVYYLIKKCEYYDFCIIRLLSL